MAGILFKEIIKKSEQILKKLENNKSKKNENNKAINTNEGVKLVSLLDDPTLIQIKMKLQTLILTP